MTLPSDQALDLVVIEDALGTFNLCIGGLLDRDGSELLDYQLDSEVLVRVKACSIPSRINMLNDQVPASEDHNTVFKLRELGSRVVLAELLDRLTSEVSVNEVVTIT
jgi:hypothetical protein